MDRESRSIKAGQRLKVLIRENYKSQEAFAAEFGIDIKALSRRLNQDGIKNIDEIQEFADFFDVSLIYFLED